MTLRKQSICKNACFDYNEDPIKMPTGSDFFINNFEIKEIRTCVRVKHPVKLKRIKM